MKKIINLILGRASIIALFILLQVAWAIAVLWQFSYKFTYANLLFRGIAILVVLIIVNKWVNPVNKLSWTFLILLSPMVGLPVYFLFGRSGLTKGTQRKMDEYNRMVSAYLVRDDAVERKLSEEDASVYNQSRYISEYAGFPLYQNTGTKYFACGEVMFQDMLEDIEAGYVTTVIVKDMSRLGRNYLQVGYYTDNYFPDHNVRFIAVNNGVDSDQGDDDFSPFRNIMNV